MENGKPRNGPPPAVTKDTTTFSRLRGITDIGLQIILALFAISVTVMLGITIYILGGLADSARQASHYNITQANKAAESAKEAERQVVSIQEQVKLTEAQISKRQGLAEERLEDMGSKLEDYASDKIEIGMNDFRDDIMRSTLLAAASIDKTVTQLVKESATVSAELPIGELRYVEIIQDVQSILQVDVKIGGAYTFKAMVAGGDEDLDPLIYLYDTTPIRLLDMNDNGGSNNDAALEAPLKPGTYYLGVGDLKGATGQCVVSVQMTEFLLPPEEH